MLSTLQSLKPQIEEVREFVDEHQTAVAVASAVVIAVIVTRKIDTRIAKRFAYRVGRENATLALQNAFMLDFVEQLGYVEELKEFVATGVLSVAA